MLQVMPPAPAYVNEHDCFDCDALHTPLHRQDGADYCSDATFLAWWQLGAGWLGGSWEQDGGSRELAGLVAVESWLDGC